MPAASLLDRASAAAAVAAQYCDEVDREGRFPHEAMRALRDGRLLGARMPADLGGEDATLADIAEVCCLLGQHCSATAMIFAMHQIKASSLVSHGAASNWHRAFMQRIAKDQLLLASSTTEAGTGGDLGASVCAIERDGDAFRLRKDASVISYATQADAILITARRAPDAPPSDQVMVVATKDQYTLDKTSDWDTLGMRGTCSEGFILEARGPAEQIFPQPFAEIAARSMLAHAHILWGSLWCGIAMNAMARAQAFVRAEARRKLGAPPLGAPRVASASTMLRLVKASLKSAIERYERALQAPDDLASVAFALDINHLKISVSNLTVDIVREALMICGVQGYKNGTPYSLGRHLRDALSAPLMISNDRIAANLSNLMLVHRIDQRLAG